MTSTAHSSCKAGKHGDFQWLYNASIWRSSNTWNSITSPIWWWHAEQRRALLNHFWTVTHAAVTYPVLDAIVSNVILMIESAQCQDDKRSTVRSAVISPDLWSVPGSYADTPSSFFSKILPVTMVRHSCVTFLFFNDDISFESQWGFASFGAAHWSL